MVKMVKSELDQQIVYLVATPDFTGRPLYPDVLQFMGDDEHIEDAVRPCAPCEKELFCWRRDV
jgi:hypothetical protein